jgi:transcriptional regulator with XRE-family HTH domain
MLQNLKRIRIEKGLSQEKLALKSNISRATISKIESWEEVEVKVSTLKALAQALECSVADFLC